MSRYLPKNTKTGDVNTQRTLSGSFFVIPERLASIRTVVLAFTANKQSTCQDGGAVGFVDFTKLSFALSSLAQPFDQMKSVPEHVFVILRQRKAYAGRFQKESRKKNRFDDKMAAPKASVHQVRNRLRYNFFLYQTNESCSQSVSRRRMLLRRFNKSCLRVTAPNATRLNGHFMNVLIWFCT